MVFSTKSGELVQNALLYQFTSRGDLEKCTCVVVKPIGATPSQRIKYYSLFKRKIRQKTSYKSKTACPVFLPCQLQLLTLIENNPGQIYVYDAHVC